MRNKLCNFVALCRSPCKFQDEFEMFPKNLELNLDIVSAKNSFLTIVLGDFNVDSNQNGIAPQFGLYQFINESTYLTRNTYSCTELIFTSQPNLVMESGEHSSLNENCHH